jgi:hypothetical protein
VSGLGGQALITGGAWASGSVSDSVVELLRGSGGALRIRGLRKLSDIA